MTLMMASNEMIIISNENYMVGGGGGYWKGAEKGLFLKNPKFFRDEKLN